MADVFVSYSRRDQEFVRRLHAALVAARREVWVDWEGIPPSAKWMDEVRAAIDAAGLFLFVVSPDSAASPVCRDEAAHAVEVGKRIVPVVWRDTPPADLPDDISAHNWLFLREADDFDAGVARLLETLDTDPEWVRAHTRLVTRAREWDETGRDRSRLLRGRDLEAAERALADGTGKDPRPTPLQAAYVATGHQAQARGQRIRTGVLSGGLVVALVLAGFALLQRSEAQTNATVADQQRQEAEEQRGEAETQRSAAEQQRTEAETQATLAKARELTAAADRAATSDPELSILLAREAVDLVRDEETDRGLRAALQASRIRARYEGCPPGEIRGLGLSQDGQRVVAVTIDGVACVWDRKDQQLLSTVRIPGAIGRNVAISPDGTRIAIATEDGAVAVYSTDGTRIARWRAHDGQTRDVAFSPDGRFLASAGIDGRATLWDTTDWHAVRAVPRVADDAMWSVRFSPDGKRLLTTNADLYTRAWDVETGAEVAQYVGPTKNPFLAVQSPGGEFVATAAQDETARIWDAGTGTQLQVLAHGGEVYAVSFSPDGSRLVTASSDGLIRIWDVQTGELIESLAGHDGAVNWALYTPDGQSILSAGRDGTVREWAAAGADTLVRYAGHFGSVFDGDVTADGSRVLTAAADGTVQVHDTATGKLIATLRGHQGNITSAAFSRDGTRVVTSSIDHTARLWDAATGEELQQFEAGDLNGAAMTPDGALVIAAGEDGHVRAWKIDGTPAWDADMGAAINDVELSRDGRQVYAGDIDGELAAFDPASGAEIFRTPIGGSGVVSVAPSPDGTRLAVLGFDARVRVLDLATKAVVLDLPATSGYGWQVHYSPDGTRLTTGGDDGAVHVYDATTGERLADLRADSRDAFVGLFLDDERVFATTRTSQAILLHCDLCGTTDEVRALADQRVTRDFTPEERVTLLHEAGASTPGGSAEPSEQPAESAEPLPSPATPVGGPPCTWVTGPCDLPPGRYATSLFDLPLSIVPPPADLLFGESGTAIGIGLIEGDQLTIGDGRAFVASDGRSLVPIGDTVEDLEAYFRGRSWMRVSPAREITVDGRPGRIVQVTSDTTQQLPYGAVGGSAFFWGVGETLDIAFVDAPGGPLLVFGDRLSDIAQATYDARFEAAVRSIRFR